MTKEEIDKLDSELLQRSQWPGSDMADEWYQRPFGRHPRIESWAHLARDRKCWLKSRTSCTDRGRPGAHFPRSDGLISTED